MAKRPEDRYASSGDLAARLARRSELPSAPTARRVPEPIETRAGPDASMPGAGAARCRGRGEARRRPLPCRCRHGRRRRRPPQQRRPASGAPGAGRTRLYARGRAVAVLVIGSDRRGHRERLRGTTARRPRRRRSRRSRARGHGAPLTTISTSSSRRRARPAPAAAQAAAYHARVARIIPRMHAVFRRFPRGSDFGKAVVQQDLAGGRCGPARDRRQPRCALAAVVSARRPRGAGHAPARDGAGVPLACGRQRQPRLQRRAARPRAHARRAREDQRQCPARAASK